MTIQASVLAFAGALAMAVSASSVLAQTAPVHTKKPAAHPKAAKKAPAKKVEPVPELVLPEADADQVSASQKVYYGTYACEFKESVEIIASQKFPSYVDVKHDKAVYIMKPVLSSTGAIRLEDIRGEMLMVQVAQKSMLLDVKTGHRLVDDCISPKQRELMEEAKAAKAAEAASAAAASADTAASAPAVK